MLLLLELLCARQDKLIIHKVADRGLRDRGLRILAFVGLYLRLEDTILRGGLLVALRHLTLESAILRDLVLKRIPEGLRLNREILAVGVLGNVNAVHTDNGGVRDKNHLIENAVDQRTNHGDQNKARE